VGRAERPQALVLVAAIAGRQLRRSRAAARVARNLSSHGEVFTGRFAACCLLPQCWSLRPVTTHLKPCKCRLNMKGFAQQPGSEACLAPKRRPSVHASRGASESRQVVCNMIYMVTIALPSCSRLFVQNHVEIIRHESAAVAAFQRCGASRLRGKVLEHRRLGPCAYTMAWRGTGHKVFCCGLGIQVGRDNIEDVMRNEIENPQCLCRSFGPCGRIAHW